MPRMTSEQVKEYKLKFAAALLKESDPFKAAFSVIGDTGFALQVAKEWADDPIVRGEKIRLLDEGGPGIALPTKEEQARDIYAIATDAKVDDDIRLKAHELYAKVRGFIEKPSQNSPQTLLQNFGVMLVRDHGSDKDWEKCAVDQQKTLIGNA